MSPVLSHCICGNLLGSNLENVHKPSDGQQLNGTPWKLDKNHLRMCAPSSHSCFHSLWSVSIRPFHRVHNRTQPRRHTPDISAQWLSLERYFRKSKWLKWACYSIGTSWVPFFLYWHSITWFKHTPWSLGPEILMCYHRLCLENKAQHLLSQWLGWLLNDLKDMSATVKAMGILVPFRQFVNMHRVVSPFSNN